jgi:hypothetical protein
MFSEIPKQRPIGTAGTIKPANSFLPQDMRLDELANRPVSGGLRFRIRFIIHAS